MNGVNIDNLNFKVILDDEKFDEKINRDIELAKQLNVQLSALLNVKSRVSNTKMVGDATKAARFQKATADAAAAQERLKTASTNTAAAQERLAAATANAANAQERLKQSQMRTEQLAKRITAQTERQNKAYAQQSRILNELKGLALGYLSIHGAGQLLSSLVRVTGEFELQKTTLAAMLGDLNAAEGVITRIQGLAVESPFQFKELTTYAKQLSAFSVPAQELYDTTKMLADISAGLGVGMDRIVLAYGQVRSAAFLRGQEVRQFTEAGIPILDELAKQFTELEGRAVSTGEVFDKISARLVPFEMVAKVFKDMTSEGGKFYNMQEVQAETLRGKISNLKDAYEVMMNEIGKGQSENLKGAVDWVRRLMLNYEETGRVIVELIAAYGLYKVQLGMITMATETFSLANHKMLSSLINAGKWIVNNPYAMLAAGVTAATFAIYKGFTALQSYEKVQKSVTDNQIEYEKSLKTETSKLDALYAKLKLAKEGTEEYANARKQIYTQYSSYISELKNEGIAVDNLSLIYEKLKGKIEESARARFRLTAAKDLEETYGEEMNKAYSQFERQVKRISRNIERDLSETEKEGFWQYLLGDDEILAKTPELHGLRNAIEEDVKYGNRSIIWLRNNIQKVIKEYADGKEKIDALWGAAPEDGGSTTPAFIYDLEKETKGKSPAQKAIEEQIKSVQKLQDAYEKLMPYLNEVQMKSTLKSLFPNIEAGVIDSLDFNAELERLADKLEKFDEDAAQRLRDTIGKDVAGTIAESFKAVEQYKKMMDSWLGEDFNLSGEGVAFDISKIISNLNSEYAKIDQKRAKALDMLNKAQMGDELALAKVREVLGEDVWQKYLENGEKVINELASKERTAAKQTADEKIRDLASKDLKERMEKANINLTDFDEKTVRQVKEQIERLKEIRTHLYDERNKIYEGGVTEDEIPSMQRLDDELTQLGVVINDTGEELDKKVYDRVREGVKAIGEFGGSIRELGDAMGASGIAKFGEEIEEVSNTVSGIADALEADDTIALIANVVSYAISSVTDVITAAYERQQALNDAAREYADTMMEIRRESYSGIFGTDEIGLAAENAKILKESQDAYAKAVEAADEVKLRGLKQGTSGIQFSKASIMDILEMISTNSGWELYAESGEINLKAIEAYYDSFKDGLTRKQRNLVKDLIESGNAVEDASAQQAQYLTSLFSGVADNIAESMIDAFLESGDAAIDMGNVISDVSRQMVSDLIKTLYLMPILNKYKEDIEKVGANTALSPTEKTEQQLNLLDTALREIAGQSDRITETIERFEDYLQAGDESSSGTSALGDGIKGITEDQANLLASYLNAIRADVSFSKTLWVKMDANLQRIADMLVSSPSLMEYQAQIAANTYNTAMATQEMLSYIRSVVTYDSGDASIRIYS